MTEETKLPLSRNEAICTLVMLVRMAADSPVAEGEIKKTLNAGFNALMVLGISSTEIEAAAIYLNVMSKKREGKP
jgi:phosphoribosylcarboxyaminoimidazole (NCAIR) mutase